MGWIIIGLSGITGGGKTTLANNIMEKYKNSRVINQDNYFYPKNSIHHKKVENLDHINYELLSALDMKRMYDDIIRIISNPSDTKNILVVDGFTVLNYKPIMELCHKKYQFNLDKEECWRRRQTRGYKHPDIPGYFDLAVWPVYCKYFEEMKGVEDIIHFDGIRNDLFLQVSSDIESLL